MRARFRVSMKMRPFVVLRSVFLETTLQHDARLVQTTLFRALLYAEPRYFGSSHTRYDACSTACYGTITFIP